MGDNASYQAFIKSMRYDFRTFLFRSFLELNPGKDFKPNWHLDVLAYKLEQVRLGAIKRLIICVPPRSLKSISASVAFPAYLLGRNPSCEIICVSYAQELADRFAGDCRALMQSSMYKNVFPRTRLASQRPALQELITTQRGRRLATSVGGVLTGLGADYLIIDDPSKPLDALSETARKLLIDWYSGTLRTRLDDKKDGRIVIIMQRLHESDLVGHLLEMGLEDWEVLRFPAIADEDETYTTRTAFGKTVTYRRRRGELLHPEREDEVTLKQLRADMGEYAFSAQYLQSPVPLEGGLVKEAWFKTYKPDELPKQRFHLQSWDTATTLGELSDYSVCLTFLVVPPHIKFADFYDNEDFYSKELCDMYLVDVYRRKMDFPTLKKTVIQLKEEFGPQTVLIEDKSSGTPLIQELWSLGHVGIQRYLPPQGCDKTMRMLACSSVLERGHIFLPEQAPWLATYLNEMRAFPHGRYDDQVDATSQAIQWLNRDKFTYYSQSSSKVYL